MDKKLAAEGMRVVRQSLDRLGINNGLFTHVWEAMTEREKEIYSRATGQLALLETTLLRHLHVEMAGTSAGEA